MTTLPDRGRFVAEASRPVRDWATLGFAMGLSGATDPSGGRPFPRPSSAFLGSAFRSSPVGIESADLSARMDFVEACQTALMATETAAVSRHYMLRTIGMAVDFLAQISTLCAVALALGSGMPMSLVWGTFAALAVWIAAGKPLLARRALRKEALLARDAERTAAPWSERCATA